MRPHRSLLERRAAGGWRLPRHGLGNHRDLHVCLAHRFISIYSIIHYILYTLDLFFVAYVSLYLLYSFCISLLVSLKGAQDCGLGVNLHFELADQNQIYQEVLGTEFPEDRFGRSFAVGFKRITL